MQPTASGQYEASLGSGFQGPMVAPGVYTITGAGGSSVGPVNASLNISSTLTWTNKVNIVDRTQPLTVTWSGGTAPGFVLIGALAKVSGADRGFLCSEQAQKGSFTVPSFVLSALPSASGYVLVAPHPFANPVSIPGLDLAYFINGSADDNIVAFR